MLSGLFLVVLAVRWQWISKYCAQLPFWDEWLDDAPLFRAFQAGTLGWEQLIAPFNGHRLLWQRLVKLGLFVLNDRQWDSQMQATMFALLGSAVPVLLAALFGRRGGRMNYPVWGAIGLLWLSPVLWYNATWAFQLCMYLQLLCTLGGMALVLRNGNSWIAGGVLLAGALFTLASGFLGAAAVFLAVGVAALRERSISARQIAILTICAGITVAGLALQHGAGGAPDGFQARSLRDFILALAANFSWPLALEAPDGSVYYIGILLWVPAPLLLGLWFFRRRAVEHLGGAPGTWPLLLALTAWVYGQMALIALLRGADGRGPSWRHYEFHAVGLVLNVVAITLLWRVWPERRRLAMWAAAGFAGLLLAGTAMQWNLASQVLELRRMVNIAQENTVREYLVTHDAARLKDRAVFETPFMFLPKPEAVLDDPVIQDILPASIGILRASPEVRQQVNAITAGPMAGTQVPPLAADKMRFAEYWSSWPPNNQPAKDLILGYIWQHPDPRFKYQQLYYVGDPAASNENEVRSLSKRTLLDKLPWLIAYRTQPKWGSEAYQRLGEPYALPTNPRFDWEPLILRPGFFEVRLARPDTWLVLTQPQGLGEMSYLAERARACAILLGLLGVGLITLGFRAELHRLFHKVREFFRQIKA